MVVAGIESPRFEMSSQCLRKSRDYEKIETLREKVGERNIFTGSIIRQKTEP
jgi:hypothetical protein